MAGARERECSRSHWDEMKRHRGVTRKGERDAIVQAWDKLGEAHRWAATSRTSVHCGPPALNSSGLIPEYTGGRAVHLDKDKGKLFSTTKVELSMTVEIYTNHKLFLLNISCKTWNSVLSVLESILHLHETMSLVCTEFTDSLRLLLLAVQFLAKCWGSTNSVLSLPTRDQSKVIYDSTVIAQKWCRCRAGELIEMEGKLHWESWRWWWRDFAQNNQDI